MEEDGGVKAAPVTRLRRRLSVELDDTKSPSAPSTPTKKRSTRLAAKPQLELIDEHAVTDSPKRTTRKSISRDLESVEKPVTPARRSARTKSNTSLVSESEEKPMTPARRNARTKSNTSLVSEADEKPLTPARRTTRIKSNTSIVSEAAQSVESPRAKRAIARRNSQVGSDTEAPLTPARTRRARKASTSSIDKDETQNVSETAITPSRNRRTRKGSTSSIDTSAEALQAEKLSLINEVITEEPEGKLRKSTSDDTNITDSKNDSPTRKSPRLMAKKGRKSKSEDLNESAKETQENSEENDKLPTSTEKPNKDVNDVTEAVCQSDISVSTTNLIKDLDAKLKKKISIKNKSMSDVECTSYTKKRDRTKSWTTLCSSSPVESNFFSDNESTKKKLKKHGKIFIAKRLSLTENTGSGDGIKETLEEPNKNEDKEVSFNTSKKNKKCRNSSISNKSENPEKPCFESTKEVNISNESNKENIDVEPVSKDSSATEILFENAPSADVKAMVFIEDSDSNTGSLGKQDKQEGEDQCVPVVMHQSEKMVDSSVKKAISEQNNAFALNSCDNKIENDSVEPMDIDETMPENVSLTSFTEDSKKPRKSSQSIPQELEDDSENKSKRKSSLSDSMSQITENPNSKDQTKHARKSSLSLTQELDNNETLNKPRIKSSNNLSNNNNKVQANDISVENLDVSVTVNKKYRKSSLATGQEYESSLVDDLNNSKRKSSLSNSAAEEHKNESKIDNKLTESNEALTFNDDDDDTQKKISRKSLSLEQKTNDDCKKSNKSKRKSSLSNSTAHEKTDNESKSTLVLSQIKDISVSETSVSKSALNANNLPKAMSNEELKDAPVNKNLALDYLTSTPVQQKNIEKLAMQMNTSVITPTNQSKKSIKASKSTASKNMSMNSKSSENDSSDEDSEESDENDESSQDKSNLFDNQAEDAGDDYESGDSQDEDERDYERQNEIIEKGETLTSEDDISNDSDYDKDSFVVSSDAEDDDLLSGSGDDLDMSDNELTLSAKSKNKYNARKVKEQKKASREIFEARHGLSESNTYLKSKKNSRSRLDSTLLKSDDDVMPPKKNKRMRLESTLESSQVKSDAEDLKLAKSLSTTADNNEIGYKKKKSKRLSESVCEENTINEKEISICNKSTTEREDPLSVQIKIEPKTPLKDLEISRVHVTDDIEQIQVDENMSMAKLNVTSDPLQSTTLRQENNSDGDDNSISENEEIASNYDFVLRELNKESKKQIKSQDISLNLNKKDKQKAKQAIVDELNLTQTKNYKNNEYQAKEKSVNDTVVKETNKNIKKQIKSHDISLNLNKKNKKSKEAVIDELNLTETKISKKNTGVQAKEKSVRRVFKKLADSDDSSDSINLQLLFSDESNGSDKGNGGRKETIGKETKEVFIPLKTSDGKTDIRRSMAEEDSLQKSSTKKNKKDKSETNDKTKKDDDSINDDTFLNFFIDTKGDLSNKASDNESDDAPVEVLYASNKEKTSSSLPKTPTSAKKMRRELETQESNLQEADVLSPNTPTSSKKNKLECKETSNQVLKTPVSETKKANKLSDIHEVSAREENTVRDEIVSIDEDATTNPKKRKRKSSLNKTADESEGCAKELNTSHPLNESALGNKKKKLKISTSIDDNQIQAPMPEAEKPEKEKSSLKKTKKNKHAEDDQLAVDCEPHTKQGKKRKQRDEEDDGKVLKVFKEHSFDKVHVPRLPPGVIDQLEDMPRNEVNKKKKAKVVSTSNFIVEDTLKRKNKPSDFLEETVYLNNDDKDALIQKKTNLKKPKVLPFLPTVSISDSGFTTNFQVNVISQKMEFVARNNDVPHFKNDYLNNKRIKKLRTYDLYKKQRSAKLSKY